MANSRPGEHVSDRVSRRADELTELAAREVDPGLRLFYLEWAKAFRRLAVFGERTRERHLD